MAFAFWRTITIDHTLCGTVDSVNATIPFAGTYSYLATVANGGLVQSALGYDIIFALDQAGTMPLPFERRNWDATTGQVEFWVQIPTLSHSTDTLIYILYGDASVTTDQQNVTGTWDSDFRLVQHFGDATTLDVSDSTAINSPSNSGAAAAAGKLGGAVATGPAAFVDDGSNSALNFTGDFTVAFWANLDPAAVGPNNVAIGKVDAGGTNGYVVFFNVIDRMFFSLLNGGAEFDCGSVSPALVRGTWAHFVARISSGTMEIFGDGGSLATASGSVGSNPTTPLTVGFYSPSSQNFTGLIDEVQVSSVARSDSWIAYSYNSQNDPSTFYTVGAQNLPVQTGAATGTAFPTARATAGAVTAAATGTAFPIASARGNVGVLAAIGTAFPIATATGSNYDGTGAATGTAFPTGSAAGPINAGATGTAFPTASAYPIVGQVETCIAGSGALAGNAVGALAL